jgi:hypothetical protein
MGECRVTGSKLNRIVYFIATFPHPYPSKVPRLLRGWIKYSRHWQLSRLHYRCGWRVLANKVHHVWPMVVEHDEPLAAVVASWRHPAMSNRRCRLLPGRGLHHLHREVRYRRTLLLLLLHLGAQVGRGAAGCQWEDGLVKISA